MLLNNPTENDRAVEEQLYNACQIARRGHLLQSATFISQSVSTYIDHTSRRINNLEDAVAKLKSELESRPLPEEIDDAMTALTDYLNAGTKEERCDAAEIAKTLYGSYYGKPYKNKRG